MESLVISIDSKENASRIRSAVKLFKGVTKVSLTHFNDPENSSILEACVKGRRTKKISEDAILNALK
jgi:hypothetical protein